MSFPIVDVPSLFEPNPNCIPVFDPALKRFGALWIPKQFVNPTAAQFLEQPTTMLCLAHQRGECQAFEQCNQIHLDVPFTEVLRQTLLSQPSSNCCLAHGDQPTRRRDFQGMLDVVSVVITVDKDREVQVPRVHMTVTSFWDQFLKKDFCTLNPLMRFNVARICRLHQRDACKFGMDCNNVHICRQFWASVQEGSPTLSPSSAPSIRRPVQMLELPERDDPPVWHQPPERFAPQSKGAPSSFWQRPFLLALPARSPPPHLQPRSHPRSAAKPPLPSSRAATPPSPSSEDLRLNHPLQAKHQEQQPTVLDGSECCWTSDVPDEPGLAPSPRPVTPPVGPLHDTLLELAEKRRLLRDGQFSLWREDNVLLAVVSQGLSREEYHALLSSMLPAHAP
eukprot:EG_transcript_6399